MAICPFAEYRGPVLNHGPVRGGPIIGVTVHHMDGYWMGAESRFNTPGQDASAAFGFRFDGSIIQWLDTDLVDYHACMAQWEGWIGFENESDPNAENAPPTGPQIASMGRVIQWLGVRPEPATSRSGGGVGYHRQFPGPCNQAWGQTACPGDGFIDAIPAICAAARGEAPMDLSFLNDLLPKEDDMISSCVAPDGTVYLFVVGTDDKVYGNHLPPGGQWTGFGAIAGGTVRK